MTVITTWLEPTGLTRGQDHLASRAICELQYTALLPGLTNVTERARYDTLYPWLLWTLDHERVPRDDRVAWFRRADCLLTLISLAHGPGSEHQRAAVGSDTLLAALDAAREGGQPLRLSTWARADPHPDRYFASRAGGFGQYYQGPLEELGVVARDADGGVTWARGLGERLARAVDARVDRARFAACVAADRVTLDDLDALGALCLCGLHPGTDEHDALTALLWRDEARRRSLGLILALARDLPADHPLDVATFRATTATGALPDGAPWALPDALERTRRRWATYQRSEWLSMAVQGLFWATLQEVGHRELPGFRAFGDAATRAFLPVDDLDAALGFDDAVRRVEAALPPAHAWSSPDHEHARALRLARPSTPREVARDALTLILALVARAPLDGALADVPVSPRHRDLYPVHLEALGARRAAWRERSLGEVLHDLVTSWGVRLHDRVALRKLRHQLNDTFQVRHTEAGGLRVEHIPPPVFGNPRFVQAVRVLQDLGALTRDAARPTALGLDLLGRAP